MGYIHVIARLLLDHPTCFVRIKQAMEFQIFGNSVQGIIIVWLLLDLENQPFVA